MVEKRALKNYQDLSERGKKQYDCEQQKSLPEDERLDEIFVFLDFFP